MKIFLSLFCFFILTQAIFSQEVTLRIQVMHDTDKPTPAANCDVHFADGVVLKANNKGQLTRKYIMEDSFDLVSIEKIEDNNERLHMVNHRNLQFILLGKNSHEVNVEAFVLDELSWEARNIKFKENVNNIVTRFQDVMSKEKGDLSFPEMQKIFEPFIRYKASVVYNLTSTIHSELSETGKEAYALFQKDPESLYTVLELLQTNLSPESNPEDVRLLARLSFLGLNIMGITHYVHKNPDWDFIGVMMEFKEAAIVLDMTSMVVGMLNNILQYIDDPEFQAVNRNDLASIYQGQEDYESAIREALIALDYYKQLERTDPEKFSFRTSAVMFNLERAYRESGNQEKAHAILDTLLLRLEAEDAHNADPEFLSLYFFANRSAAHAHKKNSSLKDAFPYYSRMIMLLQQYPDINRSIPKDMLFGDYLNYCESMELTGHSAEEISTCYEQSIVMLEGSFNYERQAIGRSVAYHKIGQILQSKGENDRAIGFYHKALDALDTKETTTTRNLQMELLHCLGEMHEDYGQHEEALEYFHRARNTAAAAGYQNDAKSLRYLAQSWYKIGQYYYTIHQPDSAHSAFIKTIDILSSLDSNAIDNSALRANTYNMLGAVFGELKHDDVKAEQHFKRSVEIYRTLADQDTARFTTDYAMAANNLLHVQSNHLETTDKQEALDLIDNVMLRFLSRGFPQHTEIQMYQENMNNYMVIFSGQATALQQALLSVRTLSNIRQAIEGNSGKSTIQAQIVSKLEQAIATSSDEDKIRLEKILAQESGNLSWYAIFDRQYELAESAALKALKLDSSQVWVNTNLAHSLILQGKLEAGKAIYLRYKNEKHTDGRMMGAIFLDDINEIQKSGISHPAFEDIKKLLSQ